MSDLLEGWSFPVSETIPISGLKILDHTFVKAPNNGPAYFNCFGRHESPKAHRLEGASGMGSYAVANCYRLPFVLPDAAGLGVYARHGVCHQAANRFLWSACGWLTGPTVHDAQAYYLSFSIYGTYGRPLWVLPPPAFFPPSPEPPPDFAAIYAKCNLLGGTPSVEEDRSAVPKQFHGRIIALHQQLHAKQVAHDPNVVINEELRLLVEAHLGADFEFGRIQEIRSGALQRANKVATSDLRGAAFANEINVVAVEYLDGMEKHLGSENYSRLLKIPPRERYALVDPGLAEQAGSRGTGA